MIAWSMLLLVTGAAQPSALPGLSIDSCVQVDADEVRRLTAIELSGWAGSLSPEELEVAVGCRDGVEEVRLTDRAEGRISVRSVDLSAVGGTDRAARERELALVIAELLRRAATEGEREAPPPQSKPEATLSRPIELPSPSPPRRVDRGWDFALGLSGVVLNWTGGELWLGVDASGRTHLGRHWIVELELGPRGTHTVDLNSGTLRGRGAGGRVGLSLDATPGMRHLGLAVGASLGGDWFRYTADDRNGVEYGGGNAGAVSAAGTTSAFVVLSDPICLTLRAAVGGALHSIQIRDNGQAISGARGVLLSGAIGAAALF
jgi:hypothetical protein